MKEQKAVRFIVSTLLDMRNRVDDIVDYINGYIYRFSIKQRKPQFFAIGYIGENIKIIKYSKKNWDTIIIKLKERQICDIILCFQTDEDYNAKKMFPDAMLKVRLCSRQINEDERDSNEILFSMKPYIFEEKIDDIVNYFKECFLKFDGIYGYMDLLQASVCSCSPTLSPIQSVMGSITNINLENNASGYFWGNIFTDKHVAKLGGVKCLRFYTKYFKLEELEILDKKAYYIQLTDNIFNFNAERCLAFKQFLKPILPKEDLYEILLYDYTGQKRELNRLVFNEYDSGILNKAKQYSQKELREIINPKKNERLIDNNANMTFKIIHNANPENLNISIFMKEINEEQYQVLKHIIESWVEVGFYGGYGDPIHFLFGIHREEASIHFTVDMGSADYQTAFSTLERVINQFARNYGLIIKEMTAGAI